MTKGNTWTRKALHLLGETGLLRRRRPYEIGQRESRDSYLETRISWIARCFGRDRYVYLVSPIRSQQGGGYVIERVEQLSYVDPQSVAIPDTYSGISDERRGYQRDALWAFNDGSFGERCALTVCGFWIDSRFGEDWGGQMSGTDDLGTPFGPRPVPDSVRVFATEQAAYVYLDNLTGEKVPAQVRHLAWLAIALSTILWQWHDEIAKLF